MTSLASASERLSDLSQDPTANRTTLLNLADAARRAAIAVRNQPAPTAAQVEAKALMRSVEELEVQSRAASSCLSACSPVYSHVLSAQRSLNTALERLTPLAQAGR